MAAKRKPEKRQRAPAEHNKDERPRAKLTPEQRLAVRDECLLMLRATWPTGEIKRALFKKYGLRHRMVMNYIRQAQDRMKKDASVDTVFLTIQAIETLQKAIRDAPNETVRIRGVEALSRLLGLYGGRGLLETKPATEAPDEHGDEPVDARRARILRMVDEARRRLGLDDDRADADQADAPAADVPAQAKRPPGGRAGA